MTIRRTLPAAALAAASALVLAGCSGAASDDTATDDGAVQVVASTSVYGQIAEAIGGDAVDVTSIVSSVSQDPHAYEASARDQLTVQRADLIIENGGGYVPSIDGLIDAAGAQAPVVTAVEHSHDWPDNDGHDHAGDDDHADEADHERIEHEIRTMEDYFVGYQVEVTFVDEATFDAEHTGMPHGGHVITAADTGGFNHTIEYILKLERNPDFTAASQIAYARAAHRLREQGVSGAFTVLEVAPYLLSPTPLDELIARDV